MTTTTTIRIRNAAESLQFVKRTALVDVVAIQSNGTTSAALMKSPRPSDGELILWDFLAYINGGDLPNMATARQILDAPNYAVAAETMRRIEAA